MAHFKEEELFYPSTWRHLQIMIKILSKLKSNFIQNYFVNLGYFSIFLYRLRKILALKVKMYMSTYYWALFYFLHVLHVMQP